MRWLQRLPHGSSSPSLPLRSSVWDSLPWGITDYPSLATFLVIQIFTKSIYHKFFWNLGNFLFLRTFCCFSFKANWLFSLSTRFLIVVVGALEFASFWVWSSDFKLCDSFCDCTRRHLKFSTSVFIFFTSSAWFSWSLIYSKHMYLVEWLLQLTVWLIQILKKKCLVLSILKNLSLDPNPERWTIRYSI